MNKALCIGGPMDGKEVEVTGSDVACPVVVQERLSRSQWPHSTCALDYVHYRFERFQTPERVFVLGIQEGMSIEFAFQKLLDRYKATA